MLFAFGFVSVAFNKQGEKKKDRNSSRLLCLGIKTSGRIHESIICRGYFYIADRFSSRETSLQISCAPFVSCGQARSALALPTCALKDMELAECMLFFCFPFSLEKIFRKCSSKGEGINYT